MDRDLFGFWIEEGNKCGFIKQYPLSASQLTQLKTTAEEYHRCCEVQLPKQKLPPTQRAFLMAHGGKEVQRRLDGDSATGDKRKEEDAGLVVVITPKKTRTPDHAAGEQEETPTTSRTRKHGSYRNLEGRGKGKAGRRGGKKN